MSSEGWFVTALGFLAAALIPIGIGNSLVGDGATVPLLVIAVPFLLLLGAAGACFHKAMKLDD